VDFLFPFIQYDRRYVFFSLYKFQVFSCIFTTGFSLIAFHRLSILHFLLFFHFFFSPSKKNPPFSLFVTNFRLNNQAFTESLVQFINILYNIWDMSWNMPLISFLFFFLSFYYCHEISLQVRVNWLLSYQNGMKNWPFYFIFIGIGLDLFLLWYFIWQSLTKCVGKGETFTSLAIRILMDTVNDISWWIILVRGIPVPSSRTNQRLN